MNLPPIIANWKKKSTNPLFDNSENKLPSVVNMIPRSSKSNVISLQQLNNTTQTKNLTPTHISNKDNKVFNVQQMV